MTQVVVAEDNDQLRTLFGTVLTRAGYTVHLCATGDQALDTIRETRADLLVTDVDMSPGISGLQLIDEVRADPSIAHVPALIVTGSDDVSRFVRRHERVLAKPVMPADLLRYVQAALRDGPVDARAHPGR